MGVVEIDTMLFAVPWQTGEIISVGFWTPEGKWRTIHAVRSAPPDEHWLICEWSNARGRYEAPVEAPPPPPKPELAKIVVAGIYGSGDRGDTGWLMPGSKHGAAGLRRQWIPDSAGAYKEVVQFIYTSRSPNRAMGDAYWGTVPTTMPFAIASDRDWEAVVRTLQTEIRALQRDVQRALGLEQRIAKMEQETGAKLAALTQKVADIEARLGALGDGGDRALEGRVVSLENMRVRVKEALEE